MKINKFFTTKAIICYLLLSTVACATKEGNTDQQVDANTSNVPYKGIVVIKVKDCEYVLWENGYGSDMEHYEGCKNPIHDCR